MTHRPAPSATALLFALLFALMLALWPWASQAQYKVIDAQGRVTYTDRPVAPEGGRVVTLGRDDTAAIAPGAAAVAALPLALRQAVARFPVTLYTAADCGPCGSGRTLLQQRGVPFNERLVAGNDAIDALQRLTGGRTVPSLAVGGQVLRGFQPTDWLATLDLAGYPRESLLPRSYAPAPTTPLVAGSLADGPAPAVPAAQAPPPEPLRTEPPPASPSGIRF